MAVLQTERRGVMKLLAVVDDVLLCLSCSACNHFTQTSFARVHKYTHNSPRF